jgi:hypothetical protein
LTEKWQNQPVTGVKEWLNWAHITLPVIVV